MIIDFSDRKRPFNFVDAVQMDFLRRLRSTSSLPKPATASKACQTEPVPIEKQQPVPTKSVDRRTFVRTMLLSILLPETIDIIAAYAFELAYRWSNKPYHTALTINDNKIVSRYSPHADENRWIRVVAAQSLADGARRWTIVTEFDRLKDMEGYIAIGISNAPAGCTPLVGTTWPAVSTPNDFLISTTSYAPGTADKRPSAQLFLGGSMYDTAFYRNSAKRTTTTVFVDPADQTMTVTFVCAGSVRFGFVTGFDRLATLRYRFRRRYCDDYFR